MASWRIIEGDCVEVLAAMEECSVDAVVCDPPYGLEFMGKQWDRLGAARPAQPGEPGFSDVDNPYGRGKVRYGGAAYGGDAASAGRAMEEWHERWAREGLRVLKPGGHLLAFGGTRTYHRLACAVEDAGFEIRDTICWLYGSGFPKSLDVSKAIDKAAGVKREVVGKYVVPADSDAGNAGQVIRSVDADSMFGITAGREGTDITAPATPEAEQWSGWGTALKPAHEPIVVARKPLVGTVAGNVLAHSTGALNIDGCRIEGEVPATTHGVSSRQGEVYGKFRDEPEPSIVNPGGRWPANVILDPDAADVLDAQTGELTSNSGTAFVRNPDQLRSAYGVFEGNEAPGFYGDSGGASRFFYVAKASRAERNAGLDGFEEVPAHEITGRQEGQVGVTNPRAGVTSARANVHPTVKPIALMRWLVRLVTPPGGTVNEAA